MSQGHNAQRGTYYRSGGAPGNPPEVDDESLACRAGLEAVGSLLAAGDARRHSKTDHLRAHLCRLGSCPQVLDERPRLRATGPSLFAILGTAFCAWFLSTRRFEQAWILIGVVLAGLLLRTLSRDSRALRLAIRNCRDTATLHAVVIGPLAKSAIVREWATRPPFASSS